MAIDTSLVQRLNTLLQFDDATEAGWLIHLEGGYAEARALRDELHTSLVARLDRALAEARRLADEEFEAEVESDMADAWLEVEPYDPEAYVLPQYDADRLAKMANLLSDDDIPF